MKSRVAEKWVKALRSGKYKQGKNVLKYKSRNGTLRHCCLGVLCELYQKEHKAKMASGPTPPFDQQERDIDIPAGAKCYHFSSRDVALPASVIRWAGMDSDDGSFKDHRGYRTSLATLNDDGDSFKKIAEVIEEQIKKL